MRAKTAESGIKMTVMPAAVRGFWNVSAFSSSSLSLVVPTTVLWVASWLLGKASACMTVNFRFVAALSKNFCTVTEEVYVRMISLE